jgi:hypothetical protein
MFEPPSGVWSAQCPFCGKKVEVPQIRAGETGSGFRKRIRKGPGWLLRLRAHMPSWANRVLVLSFVMILSSALIQSWLVAHGRRAANAVRRAHEAWTLAAASHDDAETLRAADRLLALLDTEEAKARAAKLGSKESEVRERRAFAARSYWDSRFVTAAKAPPLEALEAIADLHQESNSDSDLSTRTEKATQEWNSIRAGAVRSALDQCEAALAAKKNQAAWLSLKFAEDVYLKRLEDKQPDDEFRTGIIEAVKKVAGQFGMTIDFRLIAKTFSTVESASTRVLPLIRTKMKGEGYVFGDLESPDFRAKFSEFTKYRLEIEVSEKYGRKFEDTPHRTTTLDFIFVLKSDGAPDEKRSAVARTPRIPAKTAIGMSRIQLAKQSDERVERNLATAAWDEVDGPISQAIGGLPGPR